MAYDNLSKNVSELIRTSQSNSLGKFAFDDSNAIRRTDNPHDRADALRSNFIKDVDKILNCPFYNRYSDKTQVFSLNKNDDITRRSIHVQFVSRIARTIGKALGLNLELIEAIALSHDIGHTPFGHLGESILDKIYFSRTGKHFSHNVHSVRVLDKIFPLNLTLQTLDGIICHNGEIELSSYKPSALNSFYDFDYNFEQSIIHLEHNKKLVPCTLEGCVVRISDIVAYLGKDRQDAERNLIKADYFDYGIGKLNSEIINNLMVNIVENSFNKDHLTIEKDKFDALTKSKKQNYELIYNAPMVKELDNTIGNMMQILYDKLYSDLTLKNLRSPIFKDHINYVNKPYYVAKRNHPYENTEPNQIVVDYIASMTDDYFIDLFEFLFPTSNLKVEYQGYFDNY